MLSPFHLGNHAFQPMCPKMPLTEHGTRRLFALFYLTTMARAVYLSLNLSLFVVFEKFSLGAQEAVAE